MTNRTAFENKLWKRFPSEGKASATGGVRLIRVKGMMCSLAELSVEELFETYQRVILPVPMEAA